MRSTVVTLKAYLENPPITSVRGYMQAYSSALPLQGPRTWSRPDVSRNRQDRQDRQNSLFANVVAMKIAI
jgi:hypothetical protein